MHFFFVVSHRARLTSAGGAVQTFNSGDGNGCHVRLDGACMCRVVRFSLQGLNRIDSLSLLDKRTLITEPHRSKEVEYGDDNCCCLLNCPFTTEVLYSCKPRKRVLLFKLG